MLLWFFLGQEYEKRYGLENIIGIVDLTHLPGASAAIRKNTKKGSLSSVIIDLTEEPQAKKAKTDTEVCPCPVCSVIISRLSVAEHLENCDGMQSIFDLDLIEDIEGSDDDNSEDPIEPKKRDQSCPICSSCIEGDLKLHVDDCLNNSGIVNILDDPPDLNENKCSKKSSTNVVKPFKDCPICGITISGNLEDHVDNCLNNSIDEHDLEVGDCELPEKRCDMQTKISKSVSCDSFNSELVKGVNVRYSTFCPVCNKKFENNLEAHVNNCLNSSMSSSDFDEPIEVETVLPKTIDHGLTQGRTGLDSSKIQYVTKKKSAVVDLTDSKKACPVCAKFIKGDMNSHLDNCLNTSCTLVDFDGPFVVISDNESPVQIVESNSKFPLPKILDTINNDSERRIACRICGMKFGVTKFNGHVCYG